MFYKRTLPLIICFVVVVLAFLQEFVAHPCADTSREVMTTWFRIMGGCAVFIGTYSLLHMHVTRIRQKQQGRGYSAFVFLGAAVTGHEKIKPILIATEGFGPITIAKATYDLPKFHAGQAASADGATQIRAGVLRPEIIIPSSLAAARGEDKAERAVPGLRPGSPARIIREPAFGRLGAIKSLPEGLVRIETEAKVRVAEVEFQDGGVAVVPRANVEAIES